MTWVGDFAAQRFTLSTAANITTVGYNIIQFDAGHTPTSTDWAFYLADGGLGSFRFPGTLVTSGVAGTTTGNGNFSCPPLGVGSSGTTGSLSRERLGGIPFKKRRAAAPILAVVNALAKAGIELGEKEVSFQGRRGSLAKMMKGGAEPKPTPRHRVCQRITSRVV
jgi:hypothetical protein